MVLGVERIMQLVRKSESAAAHDETHSVTHTSGKISVFRLEFIAGSDFLTPNQ